MLALVVAGAAALPRHATGAAAAPATADTLRVMTFNVLYEPALAGGGLAARWPLVVELLREAEADLIGLEEVMPGRIEPLRRALPDHRLVVSAPAGTSRWPSAFVIFGLAIAFAAIVAVVRLVLRARPAVRIVALGTLLIALGGVLAVRLVLVGSIGIPEERLAIAWRPERLRLLRSRTIWLSPTPGHPGSHGPFDTGPHIALVAVFAPLDERLRGIELTVVDTHVGHSPLERARAVRVLRNELDPPWSGGPQILLGDLNATPDNPLLAGLGAAGPGGRPGLRDAWIEAPRRSGPAETYHWGRPARDFLPLRLDYVLLRGPLRVITASVQGKQRGEAVASDHDALVVDIAVD